TRCGFLLLAPEREMGVLRANVELQHRFGIGSSVLTPPEIAALDPRMTLDDVAGAAWEPESGFADGYATAAGFAAAARREGAEIWEKTAVQRLIVDGGRVRAVQTAAWTSTLSSGSARCGLAGTREPGTRRSGAGTRVCTTSLLTGNPSLGLSTVLAACASRRGFPATDSSSARRWARCWRRSSPAR